MLPFALSSQLFQLFLFVVGMDTNTQVGMERTTTNSLVPSRLFVTFSHTALSAMAGNLFFIMFLLYIGAGRGGIII